MTLTITLVRHGESEANAAGLWQGQGDAVLSLDGREQAAALGRRLDRSRYERVISSDLVRAAGTASLAGFDPELLESWRETDLGMWDGLTFDEVRGGFIDDLRAIRRGDDVPFGRTGET
ncbi:MAG: histidine phosphatase family protein, partial [Acidimicrobiia bacterium]|nr:histidine phosphatase family protein [Acidimicrobiia bacterium]